MIRASLISFSSIFFFAHFAQASAWLQPENRKEVITTLRYQEGDSARQAELNPFFEWGYSEDLSLGANLTYRHSESKVTGGTDFDTGFAEFFAKKKVRQTDFTVLSVQGTAGTTADTLNSPASSFNASTNPVAELRGLFGVSSSSYSWGSLFLNSELAARTFFGKKGHEWRGEEGLGWKLPNDHMVLGQFFWTKNWNETLGDQDYDSLQLQVSYVFPYRKNWHVQVGEAMTLGGQRVEYTPVYLLSVWYHWY